MVVSLLGLEERSLLENYFCLYLDRVPLEKEDLVTNLCFDFGALGVSEDLNFEQLNEKYEVKTLGRSFLSLKVFFSKSPEELFFLRLKKVFPSVEYRLEEKENEDWMEKWKEGFQAFPLAGSYWVVPSWDQETFNQAAPAHCLYIDPGMAFGTGTHETTQIAAELIYENKNLFLDKSIYEVGTGTGILSFLCERVGGKKIKADELDPVALEVAKENAVQNKSIRVEFSKHLIEEEVGSYDIIVANIIDGVFD